MRGFARCPDQQERGLEVMLRSGLRHNRPRTNASRSARLERSFFTYGILIIEIEAGLARGDQCVSKIQMIEGSRFDFLIPEARLVLTFFPASRGPRNSPV